MLRRALQCCSLASVLAISAAAGESAGAWIHGVYTGRSPRPLAMTEIEAWQQASTLAENTPAAFVLVGSGRSMHPLYAPGTILVLQKPAYGELQRGQTALYRTRQQKVVAHMLVARVRDGWRVQGLNNNIHDMEPVSPDNFVGIVIAAFQPVPPDRPTQFVTLR